MLPVSKIKNGRAAPHTNSNRNGKMGLLRPYGPIFFGFSLFGPILFCILFSYCLGVCAYVVSSCLSCCWLLCCRLKIWVFCCCQAVCPPHWLSCLSLVSLSSPLCCIICRKWSVDCCMSVVVFCVSFCWCCWCPSSNGCCCSSTHCQFSMLFFSTGSWLVFVSRIYLLTSLREQPVVHSKHPDVSNKI